MRDGINAAQQLHDLRAENARLTRLVAALTRENAELRYGRLGDGALEGPDGLRLLPRARHVRVRDAAVTLTPSELQLLRALLERRGEVTTPDVLAVAVGTEVVSARDRLWRRTSPGCVESWAGAGGVIWTVRGVGYVIR